MKIKLLSLFVLLTIGCVHVNKSILNSNPTGEIFPKEEVQVYFESDSIPKHTRIAILTGKGSDDYTDESQMIDKLREEAGKLGANAIILKGIKDPGAGQKFVSALLGTASERKGEAIAVYVPTLNGDSYPSTQNSDSQADPGDPEDNLGHEVSPKNMQEINSAIEEITYTNMQETNLPNLRKALPKLEKYSDEQIIDAYKKRHPELKDATTEELIKILEKRYSEN